MNIVINHKLYSFHLTWYEETQNLWSYLCIYRFVCHHFCQWQYFKIIISTSHSLDGPIHESGPSIDVSSCALKISIHVIFHCVEALYNSRGSAFTLHLRCIVLHWKCRVSSLVNLHIDCSRVEARFQNNLSWLCVS